MKYVKIVEAFRVTPESQEAQASWPKWFDHLRDSADLTNRVLYLQGRVLENSSRLFISTSAGLKSAKWGDYIVRDPSGSITIQEAEWFEAYYKPLTEEVSNDQSGAGIDKPYDWDKYE